MGSCLGQKVASGTGGEQVASDLGENSMPQPGCKSFVLLHVLID